MEMPYRITQESQPIHLYDMMIVVWIIGNLKACSNEANIVQHCWTNMLASFEQAFPADNFRKYKMNVIPNKECILIIHKFELNCV